VSVKGDAQSEAPSSRTPWARAFTAADRFAAFGFGGFLLLHLGLEAFRAGCDGAIPHGGAELSKPVVGLVLLGIFLPFCVFATRNLARMSPLRAQAPDEGARARAVLEWFALALVLPFTLWHVAQCAYPIMNGSFEQNDARLELVAALSGTSFGLPLAAAAYALAVGAACLWATRAVRHALPPERRGARRVVVALGLLSYLFGSYAVIRGASGPLFP